MCCCPIFRDYSAGSGRVGNDFFEGVSDFEANEGGEAAAVRRGFWVCRNNLFVLLCLTMAQIEGKSGARVEEFFYIAGAGCSVLGGSREGCFGSGQVGFSGVDLSSGEVRAGQ